MYCGLSSVCFIFNQRIKIFQERFGKIKHWKTAELAQKLNLTRERIRQLRNTGKIEFIKVRHTYLHKFPEDRVKSKI